MKARTVGLDTLTHYQRQFPQARERGDRAMAMIGHPQELSTLLTVLFQRGQRFLMRRFQTRGSSSHDLSPAVLICLLLLSGYTCCQVFFAIQRYMRRNTSMDMDVLSSSKNLRVKELPPTRPYRSPHLLR